MIPADTEMGANAWLETKETMMASLEPRRTQSEAAKIIRCILTERLEFVLVPLASRTYGAQCTGFCRDGNAFMIKSKL